MCPVLAVLCSSGMSRAVCHQAQLLHQLLKKKNASVVLSFKQQTVVSFCSAVGVGEKLFSRMYRESGATMLKCLIHLM